MPDERDSLDWSISLSDADYEGLLSRYGELLGETDVEALFAYVPVLGAHAPAALKRYRLMVDVVTQGHGLSSFLPNPPVASLVSGHFYATLPYPDGLVGDLLVARQLGGSKQEVVDILALAGIHAGPFGLNVASRALAPHLDSWTEEGGSIPWPHNWSIDKAFFAAGVDLEKPRPENRVEEWELDAIRSWHSRVHGEVPPYVEFWATHNPLALLAFRARYETALSGSLPKEFIVLCQVHLAACWGQSDAVRRSVKMAKSAGVEKEHVLQILALSMLYTGELKADGFAVGAIQHLENWD